MSKSAIKEVKNYMERALCDMELRYHTCTPPKQANYQFVFPSCTVTVRGATSFCGPWVIYTGEHGRYEANLNPNVGKPRQIAQ